MECGQALLEGFPSQILERDQDALTMYVLLLCDTCNWGRYYWTVSDKFRPKIQVGDKEITKSNELVNASVLAGRLSQPVYASVQNDIILVAEMIVNQSMDRARDELLAYHETALSEPYVKTIVSFDAACQMRSGKAGGGFSRYCFGAAIFFTLPRLSVTG